MTEVFVNHDSRTGEYRYWTRDAQPQQDPVDVVRRWLVGQGIQEQTIKEALRLAYDSPNNIVTIWNGQVQYLFREKQPKKPRPRMDSLFLRDISVGKAEGYPFHVELLRKKGQICARTVTAGGISHVMYEECADDYTAAALFSAKIGGSPDFWAQKFAPLTGNEWEPVASTNGLLVTHGRLEVAGRGDRYAAKVFSRAGKVADQLSGNINEIVVFAARFGFDLAKVSQAITMAASTGAPVVVEASGIVRQASESGPQTFDLVGRLGAWARLADAYQAEWLADSSGVVSPRRFAEFQTKLEHLHDKLVGITYSGGIEATKWKGTGYPEYIEAALSSYTQLGARKEEPEAAALLVESAFQNLNAAASELDALTGGKAGIRKRKGDKMRIGLEALAEHVTKAVESGLATTDEIVLHTGLPREAVAATLARMKARFDPRIGQWDTPEDPNAESATPAGEGEVSERFAYENIPGGGVVGGKKPDATGTKGSTKIALTWRGSTGSASIQTTVKGRVNVPESASGILGGSEYSLTRDLAKWACLPVAATKELIGLAMEIPGKPAIAQQADVSGSWELVGGALEKVQTFPPGNCAELIVMKSEDDGSVEGAPRSRGAGTLWHDPARDQYVLKRSTGSVRLSREEMLGELTRNGMSDVDGHRLLSLAKSEGREVSVAKDVDLKVGDRVENLRALDLSQTGRGSTVHILPRTDGSVVEAPSSSLSVLVDFEGQPRPLWVARDRLRALPVSTQKRRMQGIRKEIVISKGFEIRDIASGDRIGVDPRDTGKVLKVDNGRQVALVEFRQGAKTATTWLSFESLIKNAQLRVTKVDYTADGVHNLEAGDAVEATRELRDLVDIETEEAFDVYKGDSGLVDEIDTAQRLALVDFAGMKAWVPLRAVRSHHSGVSTQKAAGDRERATKKLENVQSGLAELMRHQVGNPEDNADPKDIMIFREILNAEAYWLDEAMKVHQAEGGTQVPAEVLQGRTRIEKYIEITFPFSFQATIEEFRKMLHDAYGVADLAILMLNPDRQPPPGAGPGGGAGGVFGPSGSRRPRRPPPGAGGSAPITPPVTPTI